MNRAVLLSAALLIACGPGRTPDKDRPGNNDNNPVNNTTGNNDNNTTGNNDNNPVNNTTGNNVNNPVNNTTGNNVNNPVNNTTGNNVNNTTGNNVNNTTGNNVNNTTGNNQTNNGTNNPPGCTVDTTFQGQIGSTEEHGGGVYSTNPVSNDANLDAVLAAVPPEPDDVATIPDEGYSVLANPIAVSSARVTATGFGATGDLRFFLEDRNTTIQVFLTLPPAVEVRVGMDVSFDVVAVQNFEGHPQIAEITGFTVISEDNPVPVREANNRAVSTDDYLHVVRIGGTLGTPYGCGGTSSCYPLTYPGGEVVFRSASEFVDAGDCVTFVGPVYSFPGPYQSSATRTMQLDTINYQWYWEPFPQP